MLEVLRFLMNDSLGMDFFCACLFCMCVRGDVQRNGHTIRAHSLHLYNGINSESASITIQILTTSKKVALHRSLSYLTFYNLSCAHI